MQSLEQAMSNAYETMGEGIGGEKLRTFLKGSRGTTVRRSIERGKPLEDASLEDLGEGDRLELKEKK